MKSATLHKRACKLLGVDPEKVRLVGPAEFKQLTGVGVAGFLGRAAYKQAVVYVNRNAGYDTHVHELLHILFPSRPHWWIFGAAFKLSGYQGQKYAYGSWQSAEKVTESKAELLRLAKQSAVRRGYAA